MKTNMKFFRRGLLAGMILLAVFKLAMPVRVQGALGWNPLLAPVPPPGGVGVMLLLSDGTVLASSRVPASLADTNRLESKGWWRLHPGRSGGYFDGYWTAAADMHDTRLFFSSAVLRDGRVLVAGGEYGSGSMTSEIYNPASDTWTQVPVPPNLLDPGTHFPPPPGQNKFGFSDSVCKILPNGNVLVAAVHPIVPNATLIFDFASNVWTAGPTNLGSQDEASWVKLPDDSILTVDRDRGATNSERYLPSLNKWVADAPLPVLLYHPGDDETGPAFLLPNGKAIFLGGTGKTAIYTPSALGGTNQGSWIAGPDIPNSSNGIQLGAPDTPGAMMVDGKILCAATPLPERVANDTLFFGPCLFFEYDWQSGSNGAFSSVSTPVFFDSWIDQDSAFGNNMLVLPDGNILYSHNFAGGAGIGLYVYIPYYVGSPLSSGKPTITGVVPKTDGSYHLIGTLFNGISEGAAYGDDTRWTVIIHWSDLRML